MDRLKLYGGKPNDVSQNGSPKGGYSNGSVFGDVSNGGGESPFKSIVNPSSSPRFMKADKLDIQDI